MPAKVAGGGIICQLNPAALPTMVRGRSGVSPLGATRNIMSVRLVVGWMFVGRVDSSFVIIMRSLHINGV